MLSWIKYLVGFIETYPVAAICGIGIVCFLYYQRQKETKYITGSRLELDTLTAANNVLRKECNDFKKQIERLESEIAEQKKTIEKLSAELEKIRRKK